MEHFICSPSSMTTFPANFFIPHTNKKTFFYVKASKKQSKKNLSRILTTEAAVQGIERRALSANSTRLWPKSVLEALTGAIINNQWESALKHGYASLLYEKMVAEGLKPSVDVYTSLVSVYGLSGHFQEAFDQMLSVTVVNRTFVPWDFLGGNPNANPQEKVVDLVEAEVAPSGTRSYANVTKQKFGRNVDVRSPYPWMPW
ncbi:hypothetical protein IFM89_039320 [Coptis chinensis]|uniref:Pentatricopeptide repeat-containing protein n=1 Tax=Coptis chinensis TaxID=261450 RepID=A0A835HSC1_9MAGN|nr:hypothetical protein IFM89_039320 [Coptis chinensis]